MLPNYLKIAVRDVVQNPVYAFITVTGLALSLACCIILVLFLRNELSYDTFHERADRIYRVNYTPLFVGDLEFAAIPPPVSPFLKDFFSEIEASARLFRRDAVISRAGTSDIQFEETDVYFADSTLTEIFSFETLAGDIDAALRQPNAIAISDEIASKYFGTEDVVNQTLILEGAHPFTVTGVFRAYPELSHLAINTLGAYDSMYLLEDEAAAQNLPSNWVFSHSHTYVLLGEGADPSSVNTRFGDFVTAHAPERFHGEIAFHLVPLRSIYLHSTALREPGPTGSTENVYIFSIVAFLILLVACVNFVNLSTARSLRRTREVGVRKVLGADRRHLVFQFIGESVLVSIVALGLAVAVVELALPSVNQLVNIDLELLGGLDVSLVLILTAITLLTGIAAGIYPALFVSSFRPATILKGAGSPTSRSGIGTRKALVVGQFAVTMLLLCGSMIAYQQLTYLQTRPMGFDKENVIYNRLFSQNVNNVFSQLTAADLSRIRTFKDEVERHPHIHGAALVDNPPGTGVTYRNVVPEGYSEDDNVFTASMSVSHRFVGTVGVNVIAGRDFLEDVATDTESAFLVNELAVEHFGWGSPEEAVGKTIQRGSKQGQVIGVVQNFHYEALNMPLGPMILDIGPSTFNYILFRISGQNSAEAISHLQSVWAEHFPDRPFDHLYLDATIAGFYESDENTSLVIRYFAVLAIVISLLGLFGLITLVVGQKTREIGIRKILGSSVPRLITLLSKDALKLILIACAVATPLGWYVMSRWLENFAYRIEIGPGVFMGAAAALLILASAVLFIQIARAATLNPAESIRQE